MRLLLLTAALAGCNAVFDLEAVPGLEGFHARTLTVSPRTTSELVGFPLSVVIESDADLAEHVIDGSDIGFLFDGEPLPCEVVAYDAASGTLDAWVRLPLLAGSPGTTQIELVYGAEREACQAATMWAGEHRTVFHGDLDGDRMRDRSTHGHDVAQLSASTLPTIGPGIVGSGLVYDGLDDVLCAPVDVDGSLSFGLESFSFSAWVFVTGNTGEFDMPLYKGSTSSGRPGFGMMLGLGSWNAVFEDGVMLSALRVKYLEAPSLGTWHHLVTVVDREASPPAAVSYLDGIAREVEPLTGWGSFSGDSPLCIGDKDYLFKGSADEVRIIGGTLSASSIETEYANIALRTQMIEVGPDRSL